MGIIDWIVLGLFCLALIAIMIITSMLTKTAALVRSMKVMANKLKGGTSFMEDFARMMGVEYLLIDENYDGTKFTIIFQAE